MPELKTFRDLEIKDAAKGEVAAVFSTFNVIDHDGDVTLPGAFTDGQKVRISAYNHGSWGGALPVGKGTISSGDAEAVMTGRFFMDTAAGRDTFQVVKEMDDLQEWSYGFDILDSSPGEFEGRQVRFIRKSDVHEVSPVLLGAGIGTRNLFAKSKQLSSDLFQRLRDAGRERWGGDNEWVYVDDFDVDASWAVFVVESDDNGTRHLQVDFTRGDDGTVSLADDETEVTATTEYAPKGRLKLADQLTIVRNDVKQVTTRLREVVTLRTEQGKSLGTSSHELAAGLESDLKTLREVLTSAAGNEAQTDLDLDVQFALEASRTRL